ncbi:hypothetical protein [Providencia huaxiensis]|uniref:hypothetical protein n=1 Tax=Providencia huaxiensis TaxID=2027290 RepID=UPI000C7F016F|nr:hypothetical protein [Providencia huaxiensis]AXH60522.1 hypothetical protein CYG50_00025 [Providencia huaxiensis]
MKSIANNDSFSPSVVDIDFMVEPKILGDDYFKGIEQCDVTNHAIISVDNFVINDESAKLRDRLNQGEQLTENEISLLPYSEMMGEIRVIDKADLYFLAEYSKENGRDLQPLFEIEGKVYLSLFIPPDYINEFMEAFLDKYHLLDLLKSNDTAEICVSFPERV